MKIYRLSSSKSLVKNFTVLKTKNPIAFGVLNSISNIMQQSLNYQTFFLHVTLHTIFFIWPKFQILNHTERWEHVWNTEKETASKREENTLWLTFKLGTTCGWSLSRRQPLGWLASVLNVLETEENEPGHDISYNVVCATSKASDQPAHMCSLIRAYASRSNIQWVFCYWLNIIWSF